MIRANGSANLFLLNPAGIIFGTGARLDLGGGSFYGSSADSILFPDGIEFSASDTQVQPILTINAPIGLGFRDNPGDIVNQSVADNVGLQVSPGKTISLIGGDVKLEGGLITAPGGKVELGGLSAAGTVTIEQDSNLSFPNDVTKANISLTDKAIVDITSSGGGSITVNANDLELTGESLFKAGIGEGLGSVDAVAGTIKINAIRIFANNDSQIRADTAGIGNAGTIDITTEELDFDGGSAIVASTFGQGDAGIVNINAKNISFDREWGGIFTTTGLRRIQTEPLVSDAVGNAGEINLNTNTLNLTNGAQLQVNSVAQGDAGKIDLQATEAVNFIGKGETPIEDFGGGTVISGAFSQVRGDASGNGGKIEIDAGSLTLIDKGAIIVNNGGVQGNAGEIELKVRDLILLRDEGLILSQTGGETIGNSGNINIDTGSIEITNSSLILADSNGQGDSGNISINASDTVLLEGIQPEKLFPSQIITQLTGGADGEAGDITINARELILGDISFISSSNEIETVGLPGTISINVDSLRLRDNAFISSFTANDSNGGQININATTVDLVSGGKLITSTDGNGSAGNINLNVTERIILDNQEPSTARLLAFPPERDLLNQLQNSPSGMFANSTANATGSGGNINIGLEQKSNTFSLSNDAEIRVDSQGRGEGGNILINSNTLSLDNSNLLAETSSDRGGNIELNINQDLVLNNNSLISAKAGSNASGGNIDIDARFIIATPNQNNDIVANAQQGQGGNININAESIFGIAERPRNPQTNDINASSEFGLDGSVSINTPDVNAIQTDIELPNNPIESEQTVAQACQSDRLSGVSSGLTIEGKGGNLPEPGLPLESRNIFVNGQTNTKSEIPAPIETAQGKIQPARGVKITESGEIILTAYRTSNSGDRLPSRSVNCGRV